MSNIDQSAVITPAARAAQDLAAWRKGAFLTRQAFCIALLRAGVLPVAEAKAAAKGEWPATFAAFLSNLSQAEADEAEIEWAGAANIRRLHPMIQALAPIAGLTEAQVDSLFGAV